ncbi:MAG: metallophosphoesterase [Thiotrichaceae bacterium]
MLGNSVKSILFTGTLLVAQLGYAATCPMPSFDAKTANVSVPCLIIGNNQWSVDLNYALPPLGLPADSMYWKLARVTPSTCDWSPTSCAVTDPNLDMTLPLSGVVENTKHIAKLGMVADPDGFYWGYQKHYALDSTHPIIFQKSVPNTAGAFSELYTLTGDLVNVAEDKPKELVISDETLVPKSRLTLGQQMTLRIFHFNDLHNTLEVTSASKGNTHYFSQMEKIVRDARTKAAENEVVLFVSAGDDHIGTPFDELWGYDVESFKVDPAYQAYSAAGLDAAVIGNHELDRGTALLAKSIQTDAKFPVLSANLYGSTHLNNLYFPAVIGVAKGLRIALIGVTTREETLLRQKDDGIGCWRYFENTGTYHSIC